MPRLFEEAWRRVVRHHPSLRASCAWEQLEKPLQLLWKDVVIALEQHDWRGQSLAEQRASMEAFLRADRERSFHPAETPLLRLSLCRTGDDAYCFVLSYHRMLLDGRSARLVFDEAKTIYENLRQGSEPCFTTAPPYKEYIAWLKEQNNAAAESYWRDALKDSFTTTPLAVESDTGCASPAGVHREQQVSLMSETTLSLTSLAEQHGLDLATLVQGAWALLLSRYSGEEEVVFGITMSGLPREVPGAEKLIGAFANTLPLRIRVAGDATICDWLGELKTQQDTARRFAHFSYVSTSNGITPPPTFETALILDDTFDAEPEPSSSTGLEMRDFRLSGQVDARVNIALRFASELTLHVAYDGERFDEASIAAMLGHLRTILEGFAAHPAGRLADLALLTPAEEHQLLVAWNNTATPYPHEASIHRLFEAQAGRTPAAPALVCGAHRLTYAELNERANQLAHYLVGVGVGAEVLVGICVERSVEMVVGILGILKAGGAYVPLDPAYPAERIGYMMENARVGVLVTQERWVDELPVGWAQVVSLDGDADVIAGHSRDNLSIETVAENLAYVMYTSGSTGRPKGVGISHRSVVRLVKETNFASFDQAEVFLQLAPLSFDASTFELWGALLNGARLVIMPHGQTSLAELGAALQEHGVTTLWLTAGLFHLMVEEHCADLHGLRQLLAGGDVLSMEHVNRALREMRGGVLINGYGPTENTTFSCCHRMMTGETVDGTVPIGRAISNTRVYVLDHAQRLVPVGVAGELYVGGAGLGRGYLNRAGQTAEKFVPDGLSGERGARLYRTGDIVRWRRDGRLMFVGRVDTQVKVRGFRVELGEVESALASHAGVREAVVVARGAEHGGEKRLVAYVKAEECGAEAGALREHLRERLPEYMIPSAYVVMESLPLTPNGKVDRNALPEPEQPLPDIERAYVPPRTPDEQMLAEIWAEVLGVDQVGIYDNFFELGGDSIRSIQVHARALKRGLDFTVQQLFEHQTVYELARRATVVDASSIESKAIPFTLISEDDLARLPIDVEDAYPLSALQTGMVFHSDYSSDSAVYHDIFSIHLKVACDLPVLREAIEELLARHPVLRTSFNLSGYSEPLQLVHVQVATPFEVTDLRHLSNDEQDKVVAAWFASERTTPFEWRRAPLMRFQVHQRSDASMQFSLSFHHAILDGWSMASMLTELFADYLARLDGRTPAVVPSPALAFSDFVALERQTVASEESRHFWLQKLSGISVTRIPRWGLVDDGGERRPARGAREITVASEVVKELTRLSHRLGMSLRSVLLAAHLRVLMLLDGNADVTTGVVFNGRPEVSDGEKILGLFLNTLPFRLELGGGTWEDLARSVFLGEREMMEHRRFPLIELQQMTGGAVLFDTLFNYTHFHVYNDLPRFSGVEIVDSMSSTETNFTFEANFHLEASCLATHAPSVVRPGTILHRADRRYRWLLRARAGINGFRCVVALRNTTAPR